MSEFLCQDSEFIFIGNHGNKIKILDCTDFLNNKSRIPLHTLSQERNFTILDVLLPLMREQSRWGREAEFAAALLDALLARRLIQSSQPVKVLEYGSVQGQLSRHFAELLGTFHNDSILVCAYDTIELEWMAEMEKVTHLPKLSFHAGDFGQLHLQKGYFDLVFINGMVNYEDPLAVLRDALELANEHASLICYADNTPLLESIFQLFFRTREEYEISNTQIIMTAKKSDCDWQEVQTEDYCARFQSDLERAGQVLHEGNRSALLAMAAKLKQDVQIAIEHGEIGWKLRLLEDKQRLMERAVSLTDGRRPR